MTSAEDIANSTALPVINDNSDDFNVSKDILNAQSPSPEKDPMVQSQEWTHLEITELAQRFDILVESIDSTKRLFDSNQGRLDRIESDLQAFDPSRALIPTRVLTDLTPGQIFQTVLQGVTTACVMAYAPSLLTGNEANRMAMTSRITSMAITLYESVCDTLGVKGGLPKK